MIKLIIVAVAAIVSVTSFREEWRRLRAQEHEYDEFQRHRAERQAEFDHRAVEVAHWVLMQQAAQIHFVGEVQHDRRWRP